MILDTALLYSLTLCTVVWPLVFYLFLLCGTMGRSVIAALPCHFHLRYVLSCGHQCYVFLPQGTMGRSVVRDCDIALPFLLTLCTVV